MERKPNQTAGLGKFGGPTIYFDPTDPEDEKRAWMAGFGMTSERYDEIKEKSRKRKEEFDNKYPYLKNLHWVDGEMYYTDDNGQRIDTEVALKEISESLTDSLRVSLQGRIPKSEIETKVSTLNQVIAEEKEFLKHVDITELEDQ